MLTRVLCSGIFRQRTAATAALLPVLFGGPTLAWAQDHGDPNTIVTGWNRFIASVTALTNAAITSAAFVSMVDIMWMTFALVLTIWTAMEYMFKKADVLDILTVALLMLMTRVLMASYPTLTTAIWQAGIGYSSALQQAMLGNDALFFAPQFLTAVAQSITFPSLPTLDVGEALALALNLFVLGLVIFLLSVMSYLVAMWGFWGFTLAKLIGLTFIPFLLYQRLAFLFDGWLRFFLGFVVYYMVARLNLVLVVCAIALYFGVSMPPSITEVRPTAIPEISQLSELIGLLTFAVIGILALFSTGRFASTILSGAGGGGMGMAAHGAARSLAKAALGK
ncbi:type IV secretion system protein [Eleftheria terrae]|uniref:type IV secretion system protein n=1 Tax=Eleftheria terrae TaxID=1597781 RepID=UPI00263A7826|nr:type IV secretion system protein [Eleftheria terrae]WKB50509.1 type IV secretion system protein [Eleftheria terrae]